MDSFRTYARTVPFFVRYTVRLRRRLRTFAELCCVAAAFYFNSAALFWWHNLAQLRSHILLGVYWQPGGGRALDLDITCPRSRVTAEICISIVASFSVSRRRARFRSPPSAAVSKCLPEDVNSHDNDDT
uniref:Transposase n=1 Tax=Steinernema glaseri TaxID=37863 RepID=A0A1I7YBE1_9BILA